MSAVTSTTILNEMMAVQKTARLIPNKEHFRQKNQEAVEKAELAKSLGFSQMPVVTETSAIEEKIEQLARSDEELQTQLSLVDDYRRNFPLHRFVPEIIFQRVLDKYDLYTGRPGQYVKEIPMANLKQFKEFREQYDHWPFKKERDIVRVQKEIEYAVTIKAALRLISTSLEHSAAAADDIINHPKTTVPASGLSNTPRNATYQIAAPAEHFNWKAAVLQGRNITDDPIITMKVPGGRIIITAWDKEAMIPEIINPITN